MRATTSPLPSGLEEDGVTFWLSRERVFRQAARVRSGSSTAISGRRARVRSFKSRHRLAQPVARFNVLCRRYVKSVLLSPVTYYPKVDSADQIRTERLGGAHGGHRLLQGTDVRSERHDSAQHHGNRSDRGDLIGPEQAEHHQERQRDAAGDGRLGNHYDLPASLGDLCELLELRFDPRNLVGRV